MTDCKNLIIKDITPWHSDIFDHPTYECTCKLSKRKIIPLVHCNCARCENYKPITEKENEQ